jgi:hypothetical protein
MSPGREGTIHWSEIEKGLLELDEVGNNNGSSVSIGKRGISSNGRILAGKRARQPLVL